MTNDEFIEKITSLETAPLQEVAQFIKARKNTSGKYNLKSPSGLHSYSQSFQKKS